MTVDGIAHFQTKFLVFFGSFARTVFAQRSPSGAHSAATVDFGHLHQPVGVSGAHAVGQLAEAETRASICAAAEEEEDEEDDDSDKNEE